MTQTHALNGPAWIVVPADQPEQFAEAAQAADVVVLDLHNGVLPRDKEFARQCILECPLDPARTVIRVNPVGTDEHTADLQALETTTYRRVVVPQVESAQQIAGLSGYEVVASIDSPQGALALGEVAGASGVVGLVWGSEDLIGNLGGLTSRKCNGALRDISLHVRSQTLLHAKVNGILQSTASSWTSKIWRACWERRWMPPALASMPRAACTSPRWLSSRRASSPDRTNSTGLAAWWRRPRSSGDPSGTGRRSSTRP